MRATFYVLTGGFIAGVVLRSLIFVSLIEASLTIVLAVCVLGVGVFIAKETVPMYVGLFLCATALGIVWTQYAYVRYESNRVFQNETPYEGLGVVSREPDIRDDHSVLYVSLSNTPNNTPVVARMNVPLSVTLSYGEIVHVSGIVRIPEVFITDTGREFDYPGFLMKEGVQYIMSEVTITPTGRNSGNKLTSFLLTIKHAWMRGVSVSVGEPGASLVNGVVVGAKQSLGETLLEKFRDTGIVHIVVLSGYNLTLVANAIVRGTQFLPGSIRFILGSSGIVCFALLVGGGATVVRASIMAVLGMLAPIVRRPYVLVRALFLAGVLMVIWNPFVLVFDAGFQLSFMATLGLVLLSPLFEERFQKLPAYAGMRTIVSATCATQLAVLPLLFYHIGTVSLVAPFVNVLILPVVPVLMALGTIVGGLGVVHGALAFPFSGILSFFLAYVFWVVELFAKLPLATFHVSVLPWFALALMYVPIGWLYWYMKKHSPAEASAKLTRVLQ